MKLKILFYLSMIFSFVSCNISFDNAPKLKFETVRKYIGYRDLPSLGSPKMLVIPVVFKDCALSETELENEHKNIVDSFTGNSEDTYWESVKSFYYKSSYGKLDLDINVSPYFYSEKTIVEENKLAREAGIEPTYNVLSDAALWYAANYDDYNSYDSNGDGLIDSIWLIYMDDFNNDYFSKHPDMISEYKLNDFLWAYTYWYVARWDNKDYKKPFAYAWASYKFLYEGDSNGKDAHTLIHETGHLFGLEDYYNYDYDGKLTGDRTKPTGALDMMDNNVYDHNAYTKYLLDWIEPTVVSNDTYTLPAFQNNGDALIVKTSNNNSAMDEYLIIEYFTPTGLNELDSKTAYTTFLNNRFTEPGFKIYHVDSRLGVFKYKNYGLEFEEYYDNYASFKQDARKDVIQIAHSNTPSRSGVKSKRLICLLSAVGKSRLYFKGGLSVTAQNKDLFQKGDSLSTFTFNSYQDDDLLIEILESNESEGVIRFSGVGK